MARIIAGADCIAIAAFCAAAATGAPPARPREISALTFSPGDSGCGSPNPVSVFDSACVHGFCPAATVSGLSTSPGSDAAPSTA